LTQRCASTPGGTGNLSGDSESSLNPSQGLSRNQPAVGVALTRSKAARERGERERQAQDVVARSDDGRWSLMVHAHGTWTERTASGSSGTERGFDGSSQSLEGGLDYRVSEKLVLGLLLGTEKSDYDFDAEQPGVNFLPAAKAGDSEGDNLYLTAFGSMAIGASGFVEISGGYERSDSQYRRYSVFQESTRTIAQTNVAVEGDADGSVTWFSANGGFDVDRGSWGFGPYLGVSSVRAKLDGYVERDLANSGLNMRFSATKRRSMLAHAGAQVRRTFSGQYGVFVAQLRAELQRDFEDDPELLTAAFALDPRNTTLTLNGQNWDRTGYNLGFSLSATLQNGWMPFLDYAVVLGYDNLDRQRATLGLRYEF
jgi:uncharacterized protein YhjY with autotransporter beta-barrel domain